MNNPKVKLTVTINKTVLDEAKKISEDKHISLSGIIENFLKFFTNPTVYCFECGQNFSSKEAEICLKCGWMVCPRCRACGCGLSEETIKAIFNMRRVLEDLLVGRVK